jgi:hypothetical protein
MDKETLAHVFEPFFTTKGVGQGTRPRLATVYGECQAVGRIRVGLQRAGPRNHYQAVFPYYAGRCGVGRGDAGAGPGGQRRAGARRGRTSRADDRRPRTHGRRLSRPRRSGERALDVLRQNGCRPALVLVDVVMPGMGGSDPAEEVVRLVPGVPMLFTSGYTDAEILRRGLLEPGPSFCRNCSRRKDWSRQ